MGLTPVPDNEVAAVVTSLEMTTRPPAPPDARQSAASGPVGNTDT
ncbi:MAG: hypothetical protein JWL66_3036 [Sphingomonadales bacterium]|nr:hypothetical protein [Sphingomonadales bacterium]